MNTNEQTPKKETPEGIEYTLEQNIEDSQENTNETSLEVLNKEGEDLNQRVDENVDDLKKINLSEETQNELPPEDKNAVKEIDDQAENEAKTTKQKISSVIEGVKNFLGVDVITKEFKGEVVTADDEKKMGMGGKSIMMAAKAVDIASGILGPRLLLRLPDRILGRYFRKQEIKKIKDSLRDQDAPVNAEKPQEGEADKAQETKAEAKEKDPSEIIESRIQKLEAKLKESKYLTDERRMLVGEKLRSLKEQYKKDNEDVDAWMSGAIDSTLDEYVGRNAKAADIGKDVVNLATSAGGLYVVRGIGYAGMALMERWNKLSQDKEQQFLKERKGLRDAGESQEKIQGLEKGKIAIFKEFIYEGITSNTKEMFGQGKLKEVKGFRKALGVLGAWGKTARFAGIGAAAYGQYASEGAGALSLHGMGDSLSKRQEEISKLWEGYKGGETGVGELVIKSLNIHNTADRMMTGVGKLYHGVGKIYDNAIGTKEVDAAGGIGRTNLAEAVSKDDNFPKNILTPKESEPLFETRTETSDNMTSVEQPVPEEDEFLFKRPTETNFESASGPHVPHENITPDKTGQVLENNGPVAVEAQSPKLPEYFKKISGLEDPAKSHEEFLARAKALGMEEGKLQDLIKDKASFDKLNSDFGSLKTTMDSMKIDAARQIDLMKSVSGASDSAGKQSALESLSNRLSAESKLGVSSLDSNGVSKEDLQKAVEALGKKDSNEMSSSLLRQWEKEGLIKTNVVEKGDNIWRSVKDIIKSDPKKYGLPEKPTDMQLEKMVGQKVAELAKDQGGEIKDLVHKSDTVYMTNDGKVVFGETSGLKAGYLPERDVDMEIKTSMGTSEVSRDIDEQNINQDQENIVSEQNLTRSLGDAKAAGEDGIIHRHGDRVVIPDNPGVKQVSEIFQDSQDTTPGADNDYNPAEEDITLQNDGGGVGLPPQAEEIYTGVRGMDDADDTFVPLKEEGLSTDPNIHEPDTGDDDTNIDQHRGEANVKGTEGNIDAQSGTNISLRETWEPGKTFPKLEDPDGLNFKDPKIDSYDKDQIQNYYNNTLKEHNAIAKEFEQMKSKFGDNGKFGDFQKAVSSHLAGMHRRISGIQSYANGEAGFNKPQISGVVEIGGDASNIQARAVLDSLQNRFMPQSSMEESEDMFGELDEDTDGVIAENDSMPGQENIDSGSVEKSGSDMTADNGGEMDQKDVDETQQVSESTSYESAKGASLREVPLEKGQTFARIEDPDGLKFNNDSIKPEAHDRLQSYYNESIKSYNTAISKFEAQKARIPAHGEFINFDDKAREFLQGFRRQIENIQKFANGELKEVTDIEVKNIHNVIDRTT